jgi:hypothetical protein
MNSCAPPCAQGRLRSRVLLSILILAFAVTAAAQEPSPSPDPVASPEPASAPSPVPASAPTPEPPSPGAPSRAPRSLGQAFDVDLLASLPMSNGVWSIFETIESTAILDRIESSGLYVGEAGLMGVRGSSWTQASWLLGDFDITDPDRTGTPLFFADPEALAGVEISAGLAPADLRGAGPGVRLLPRRPDAQWRKTVAINDAPSSLQQAHRRQGAPAIAHLDSFSSARFRVGGPLKAERLHAVLSGNLTRGARRERSDPRTLDGREAGVLSHFVYTPTLRDEVRLIAGAQRLSHPYAGRARFGGGNVQQVDHFLHVQSTWQRQGRRPWSVTAGIVRGRFDPHLTGPATGTVERLYDGPVQQQFPADSTRGRGALTGWFDPFTNKNHAVRIGTSLALTRSSTRPAEEIHLTPEKVGGLPARVWDYGWTGPTSWRGDELAVYLSDQFHYRQLSVHAGVRYESSRASAANSEGRIEWTGVTPRIVGRVRPLAKDRPGLTLLAGYAEYLSRLPLNLLAYGDPNAPHGAAYRWEDQNLDGLFQPDERSLLVARVGPGGPRVTIDTDLKPPRSKEVFIGFETDIRSFRARFLAYHRSERDFVTSVNYGAPVSAYDVTYIPDPGDDIVGGTTLQVLPIYNRRLESFGRDRYLLTNDATRGTGKGMEISIDGRIHKRVRVLVGATASKTDSPSAYRGYLATENDQGLVGERLELPNAETLSKGRLFFERGYTIKIAGTYDAPYDIRFGAVARYQDGQHFARFVIPRDLNQGPEPIKAIYNGDSRFTYVLTIDARLEKGFTLGRTRLSGVVEAFNIRGTGIEVEEDVIWGPSYRATSAVQPPRALRLGLRLDF